MKEHFEKQLNNGSPLTEEDLSKLRGRYFDETKHQTGDVLLYMMLEKKGGNLEIVVCCERLLPKLNSEYEYLRTVGDLAVFKGKD